MIDEEIRGIIETIHAYDQEVQHDPRKALAGLVAAGICNPDGTLTPPYVDDSRFGAWGIGERT